MIFLAACLVVAHYGTKLIAWTVEAFVVLFIMTVGLLLAAAIIFGRGALYIGRSFAEGWKEEWNR